MAKYGAYMDIKIYDTGQENEVRDLFERVRLAELAHRKVPLELLSVTPQTGVAAEPFDDSVAVAVTLSANVGLSGTTMVSPASCSGVRLQVPLPVFVPADSTAPAGTPEIVTDSTSEPSVSLSAAEMASGIAAPSVPDAVGVTASAGASATAPTVTETFATRDTVPSLSVTL